MKSVLIGEAVRRLLSDDRYAEHRSQESVFAVWDEVVGQPESQMARPLSVEAGVLTVGAATSTVASEVSLSQERYLQRLNRYFGTGVIRELRVRVLQGTPPVSSSKRTKPGHSAVDERREFDPSGIALTAAELRWAEQTAAAVESRQVRAALKRVLILRLKHDKWVAANPRKI